MEYEISRKYKAIAESVINAEPELRWIREIGVQIGYLRSFKEKKSGGRLVFGECTKVSELYEPFCPYDFLIVIFEPNIAGFTKKQIQILLHHELLHVGMDEKNGELRYRIVPHDVEDFYSILDRYGTRWSMINGGPADKGGG